MLTLQFHTGKLLCDLGWHGFSGLADGSDSAYYEGAKQSLHFETNGFTNIIPWNGFTGGSKDSLVKHYHNKQKGVFNLDFLEHKRRAKWLGLGARGGDHGLSKGGISLHSRNAMQVLGLQLRRPVALLHCWAKPIGTSGRVDGGTATAVALAMHFKINVVNLATRKGLGRTLVLLKQNNVDIDYDYYNSVFNSMSH